MVSRVVDKKEGRRVDVIDFVQVDLHAASALTDRLLDTLTVHLVLFDLVHSSVLLEDSLVQLAFVLELLFDGAEE